MLQCPTRQRWLAFRRWLPTLAGVCSLRLFFFSSRRRHTRSLCDWSSDVCSSDLGAGRRQGRHFRRRPPRPGHRRLRGGQGAGAARFAGHERGTRDRKSTRLNSSHTEIYTLSLHDALPISRTSFPTPSAATRPSTPSRRPRSRSCTLCRPRTRNARSEEHTSELQSHRDLHSFPTRRSSDLKDVISDAVRRDQAIDAFEAAKEQELHALQATNEER